MPLCWKFNSLKNKYFVVGDDSSELALAAVAVVAADPAEAAVTSDDDDDEDDEHNNDLLPPLNVSLVKFSAMSDAIFVSWGPINACNSS